MPPTHLVPHQFRIIRFVKLHANIYLEINVDPRGLARHWNPDHRQTMGPLMRGERLTRLKGFTDKVARGFPQQTSFSCDIFLDLFFARAPSLLSPTFNN